MRTTVDFPWTVRERIRELVSRGAAKSRNAVIVDAVQLYFREIDRRRIDAEFARMAGDGAYRSLLARIEKEFAAVDWAALQDGERYREAR